MFVELHMISPALGEWLSRSSKVTGNGTNTQATWYFLLVVCSNNVSISRHFFDTTTFMVYVTACRAPNLEKSIIFGEQLRLKTIDTFPSMYTHSVSNRPTCHIHWWIGVRKSLETATVTLKVTQGHRYCCHSIRHMWFPISISLKPYVYLAPLLRY